jgi:hypothetical protein
MKMSDQFVYGYIDSDGTVISGSGIYTVDHDDTGVYSVTFENEFADKPAVTVAQVYTGDKDYGGGYLSDNAVIIYIDTRMAKFLTGTGENHRDRQFSFIAMGPAED